MTGAVPCATNSFSPGHFGLDRYRERRVPVAVRRPPRERQGLGAGALLAIRRDDVDVAERLQRVDHRADSRGMDAVVVGDQDEGQGVKGWGGGMGGFEPPTTCTQAGGSKPTQPASFHFLRHT